MPNDPRAGTPATAADLVDVEKLLAAYHDGHPDPGNPAQAVAFGTSGHRGSSLATTFNDDHIAATTQAIVEYRAREGTDGPLFVGADTHALSEPAWQTCVEVLWRTASPCWSTPPAASPPPRPCRTRSSPTTAAVPPASPTASSSPRRTTRRRTAASSTTRRTAAPPTPRPPGGSTTGRTSCSRRSWTGCGGGRWSRRAARSRSTTSSAATSTTCPPW